GLGPANELLKKQKGELGKELRRGPDQEAGSRRNRMVFFRSQSYRSNRSDFRKVKRVTVDRWTALARAYGRTFLLLSVHFILKIYRTGNACFAYLLNLLRRTYLRGIAARGKCHGKQKQD